MSSENVANIHANTIKGHGLVIGDRFHFHGMAGDPLPTIEGTRVVLGKVGNKYMLTTVAGDVHTWEFGASAKVWADTTIKHDITVSLRYLANGDVVYVGTCEHGWETGLHTTEDDAYAVVESHGEVSRPLYVAVVTLVKADARHAAALAAEVPSILGKRAWGPNGLQGTIESTYSDGSINLVTFGVSNIIPAGRWKLMPSVEIHTGDGTVITEDDVKARVRQAFGPEVDDVPIEYPTNAEVDAMMAGIDPYAKITESEVWAGTGTMIKRPIRTKLGKRKRKASKVNARRVRGGF